jgi:hypothetical protein
LVARPEPWAIGGSDIAGVAAIVAVAADASTAATSFARTLTVLV